MELYVVSNWFKDHPKKREYFEKHANIDDFPIVNFQTQTIKANKLHKTILDFGDKFEEKMGLLKKFIGAYATDNNQPFKTEKPDVEVIGFKITPSLAVVKPFMHGWYSDKTSIPLEGAIQYYKPKTIVELGVWYGKSSVAMFQASKHKLTYYGFDFFTATATNPKYVSMSPLDKLFIDHSRLETAVANVAPYSKKHNIYFINEDVLKSLDFLKKNKIVPDLIFIDAIKNTQDLVKTIKAYLNYNPDIVIVGDDYVYDTVKKATTYFDNKKLYEANYIVTNKEIPDEFPEPVSDFSQYPSLKLTESEKKQVPKDLQYYIV